MGIVFFCVSFDGESLFREAVREDTLRLWSYICFDCSVILISTKTVMITDINLAYPLQKVNQFLRNIFCIFCKTVLILPFFHKVHSGRKSIPYDCQRCRRIFSVPGAADLHRV